MTMAESIAKRIHDQYKATVGITIHGPDEFWDLVVEIDPDSFTLSSEYGKPIFIVFTDHSSLMLTPDGQMLVGTEVQANAPGTETLQ